MFRTKLVLSAMSLITAAGLAVLTQDSATGSEVVPSSPSHRAALPTYPQLLTALSRGEDVAVTIAFRECTAADTGAPGPAVTGGLRIHAFLASQDSPVTSRDNSVAFSDVHETLDPQNHPVTEYIRYKVTPDDIASVNTTTLSTDSRLLRSTTYRCPMGSGASFTAHDG